MKKKLTALGLVLAVVASLFAGMTLTYFTDKGTVTNTFTVGNVDIKVYETDANGQETEAGRLYENVVPGVKYAKDPTIKNIGRNDAYARMLVTVPLDLFQALATKGITDLTDVFGGHGPADWVFAGSYADTTANTMTYVYNYKNVLPPNASATLFTSFTLPSFLTQEDLANWDRFYIVVEGQAIQKEGFDTADDAYGALETACGHTPTVPALVTSAAEFSTAVSGEASTIVLTDDVALTAPITITGDCTVIGNGDATISTHPVTVASDAEVTFKNVNFETPDNTSNKASSVYASGLEGKVVFDGCTFTNPQWECIQITPKDGAEVIVTNCKFVADGNGVYAHGTKVERLLHIQNTDATGKYKATITNNQFVGVDLCRNAVIDVDDIEAFANVTCGGNTFYNHDYTPVSSMADGMIYVNINGLYDAANVATNTFAQFTRTPAAALVH